MALINAVFILQAVTNRLPSNTSDVNARGAMRCSGQCDRQRSSCNAFAYQPLTSTCTLIGQFIMSPTPLTKYWIRRTGNCPIQDGYLYLQPKDGDSLCIYFHFTPELWDAAQAKCTSKGDNLIQLDTDAKIHLFKSNVLGKSEYKRKWWIGLKDVSKTNVYVWPDGSNVTAEDWDVYQPDFEYYGSPDDCVILDENTFKWSDYDCFYQAYSYICERKM